MKISDVKKYLGTYLEDAIKPRFRNSYPEYQEVSFTLNDVIKGTYQPPMIHVFIDVEPHDMLKSSLKETEKDIEQFFRLLSIPLKIKIHWNKRPIFKKGKEYDKNI